MRPLPLADPSRPDLRSPSPFRVPVAWLQCWTVLGGMVLGIRWMTSQALVPFVVDDGIDRVAVEEDGRVSELGRQDEPLELGGSYAALRRSWQSA